MGGDEGSPLLHPSRARSLGAKLIIIDAFANVIGLTDESNPVLIQPILKRLHQLAEDTGAAVVVIHHTNKDGVFRGSSFIASSVDNMLYVESQRTNPSSNSKLIKPATSNLSSSKPSPTFKTTPSNLSKLININPPTAPTSAPPAAMFFNMSSIIPKPPLTA